ncbi:Y-family DNA polymerase [Mycoplasma simbae]|uniref:Y-family DNA polymerase n=1 Tax=Mycoplasma simbae TaxID=36744 RepID=UPI0004968B01|nr:DNA polymerase IV [Mycoplasma simbae]
MDKIIFHIDFDSYFASAHRVINPQYDNKPIAIGRKLRRSIACSVSYELKNKGAKSGWPNYKILELEPRTIFIEPDFNLYITLSNKIFNFIAQKYTKNIEVYSIDECWLDASEMCKNKDPELLARKMQRQIREKFRIPISVGISHNKFLAKLSTNLAKPYGVLHTTWDDIEKRIWPLEIEEYFGIGKSTALKLRAIGINTIGDLAARDVHDPYLYTVFRSLTKDYVLQARGEGPNKLNYEHNELKSIGNELTFLSFDIDEREEILKILYQLCKKVSLRAKNRNLLGYVITFSMRTVDKTWFRKQQSIKIPTNDTEEIYEIGSRIFNKVFNDEYIRGIGIKLSSLVNEFDTYKPQSLFDTNVQTNTIEKDQITQLIDKINTKIKKKGLKIASEFVKDEIKDNIHSRYLDTDLEVKN